MTLIEQILRRNKYTLYRDADFAWAKKTYYKLRLLGFKIKLTTAGYMFQTPHGDRTTQDESNHWRLNNKVKTTNELYVDIFIKAIVRINNLHKQMKQIDEDLKWKIR